MITKEMLLATMRHLAEKGGRSRSDAKIKAAFANLEKANAARRKTEWKKHLNETRAAL